MQRCHFIVGAVALTLITTEYPTSEIDAVLRLGFDGVARYAAPGVNRAVTDNGPRRTGINAAPALPTADSLVWFIVRVNLVV